MNHNRCERAVIVTAVIFAVWWVGLNVVLWLHIAGVI